MRVAVTTSPDAYGRVANPLQAVGLEPVALPCIRIVPGDPAELDRLRQATTRADLLVITSGRSVAMLWRDGGMPPVPVAAVGASSARAVEAAGGLVYLTGDGGAARLAELLEHRVLGLQMVFPHARAADPSITDRLRKAGATVIAGAAYGTEPVAPGGDAVEAVVLGSPSGVTGWCLTRSLDDVVVAAMGETTADAVSARGGKASIVPGRPRFEEVARELSRLAVDHD